MGFRQMAKYKPLVFLSICFLSLGLIYFRWSISQNIRLTNLPKDTNSKTVYETVYKYGFINKTGKYVVPPQFDSIGDFSEGLALVAVGDKRGYIDKTGKIVIPLKFEYFALTNLFSEGSENFSEGLAAAIGKTKGKLGYIDKTGNYVISPQFDETKKFSEGLAAVEVKGQYGYINKQGNYVIKPQFEYASNFLNGLAIVQLYEVKINNEKQHYKYGLIDKTGKYIAAPKFDQISDTDINRTFTSIAEFKEGLMHVGMGGDYYSRAGYINVKWGLIDRRGKIVIPMKFDGIGNFSNGRAVVFFATGTPDENGFGFRVGKMGYIDRTGKVVIPPKFDEASKFSKGVAAVTIGKKSAYIDVSGKFVPPPIREPKFSEGLTIVRNRDNGLYGYVNKKGKFVIPPHFSSALDFNNGLARVEVNGKSGLIDKKGKYIVEPKFDSISGFSEGMAIVGIGENRDKKYGYVDQTGKIVINPQFADARPFDAGFAIVLGETKVKVKKDCDRAKCNNKNQPSGTSLQLFCKLMSAIKGFIHFTNENYRSICPGLV